MQCAVTVQAGLTHAMQLPAELLIVMDVRTSVQGRGLVHQTAPLQEGQVQPATATRCAPQEYAQVEYAKPNTSQAPISVVIIPAPLHPAMQQTLSAQLATITPANHALQPQQTLSA